MSKQRFVVAGVAAVAPAGPGGTAFALQGQSHGLGGTGPGTRATVTAYGPDGTVLARDDVTGPLR
ncbi:hypothetical protein [Streptomyces radiopugnans]|uniref:hypothetical protein n=1 Tax=Streptomyces radiopugnans TaxID=403935 RepID=UPI003F1CE50F